MGGGDILIDSIEIYAQMYAGSSDNIHMYLYGHEGLVGTLEPDEAIGAAGNYMFSPTESLILDAGLYDLIIQPDFVVGTWMSWRYAPGDDGAEYSEAVGTTWGGMGERYICANLPRSLYRCAGTQHNCALSVGLLLHYCP